METDVIVAVTVEWLRESVGNPVELDDPGYRGADGIETDASVVDTEEINETLLDPVVLDDPGNRGCDGVETTVDVVELSSRLTAVELEVEVDERLLAESGVGESGGDEVSLSVVEVNDPG